MRPVAAALLLVFGLVSCGGSERLEVGEARIGQPTGPNAALYFTASSGSADRLLGADTDAAASVELHESVMGDDGTVGMKPIDGLDLTDGTMTLEPGGYHLMLVEARRMEIGDTIEVTLHWEKAGDVVIEAVVVDPAETMSDGS